MEFSCAHLNDMNPLGQHLYPDGLVPWRNAQPPNLTGGIDEQPTGLLRQCAYCGSMHPADVVTAIQAGARGEWADMKYGWPHKAYFHGIPNPHAGKLESRAFISHPTPEQISAGWRRVQYGFNPHTGEPAYHWAEPGTPADPTTWGKFYSIHLQDASPDDRAVIEQHLGLSFTFTEDGRVEWKPVAGSSI